MFQCFVFVFIAFISLANQKKSGDEKLRQEAAELTATIEKLTATLAQKAKSKTDAATDATKESLQSSLDVAKKRLAEVSEELGEKTDDLKEKTKTKAAGVLRGMKNSVNDLTKKVSGIQVCEVVRENIHDSLIFLSET